MQIFPWKRFWCTRTGEISMDDNGFFLDPELEYSRYYHKGVVAFEEIRETPCLILLGEPGIGKTVTLKLEIDILERQIIANGDKLLYKNLNEYGNEARLIDEIFKSSTIQAWLKGQHHLHLFLDSVYECLLEIHTLATILRNQFQKFKKHANRLSLRISCRTADWPEILKEEFDVIWGEKNVEVYQLAPLRRKDVKEAAHVLGLDASSFIGAIEKKEIQSLAGNPITLSFLLEEFKNKQQFPDSRPELFLRGCEHLCTENNPTRQAAQQIGTLPTTKRLALAARIAAVMIFCNRTSVCLQKNISDSKETDLTLQMLQEGNETTGDYTFDFAEDDIREVVKYSALFSGRGPHRFGFVHKSYAEFLAARYLSLHQLSIPQIKSLILLSNDPDQMVIPQLKETIAWLNSIMPKMIQLTIKTDPQSMLSCDIASMESRFRRDLVESLLKQFELQKIIDTDWGHYSQYQKLKHPDVDSQLKPYIKDNTKNFLVRRVAIDIAEACKVVSLQDLLADVALDHLDNIHVRGLAAHAVLLIADDKTRLRLKPLAMKIQEDDKDDQLKGYALHALWPNHLSAQEIFNILTPPKQENFYGSYKGFLMNFPEQLNIRDLPYALKWAKRNLGESTEDLRLFAKLTDNILFRAWCHLDNSNIRETYADVIISRLDNYLSICPTLRSGTEDQVPQALSDETRKDLIKAIVSKVTKYRTYLLVSGCAIPLILFPNDLEWLITQLKNEKHDSKKEIWVEMADDIFSQDDVRHIELIYNAMPINKLLKDKFRVYFDAIEINSRSADEMRKRYRENKNIIAKLNQMKVEKKGTITHDVYERIKTCLDQFENGDSRAWVQLCKEMTWDDNNKHYGFEISSNLMTLPGWKVCDGSLKERIGNASKKYILESDANTEHWLGKNSCYPPAIAGYKAFVILSKLGPEFLNNLSIAIWENWVSIIIECTGNRDIRDDNQKSLEVIKQAYQKVPQKFIDTLLVLIDKENEQYDHLFIIREIECCLDKLLQDALLHKAKDGSLKHNGFQGLLSCLLKAKNQDAKSYAKSLLSLPLSSDSDSLMRAKASALALLAQAEDAGWDVVWDAIREETDFGKDILMSMPDSSMFLGTKNLPDRIGEKNIADLFIWLNKTFPPEEDPDDKGAHEVSSRESLAHYRDSLLRSLEAKGTQEAVRAIEYIQKELPALGSLNFYLVNARENMRRVNWSPLSPEDFLLLTNNSTYQNPLELKPNFFGFGIDLKKIPAWFSHMKNKWNKNK